MDAPLPKSIEATLLEGDQARKSGDLAKAEALYRQGIAESDEPGRGWDLALRDRLADLLERQGNHDEIETLYRQAIASAPEASLELPFERLGRALRRAKQPEAAVNVYLEGLARAPHSRHLLRSGLADALVDLDRLPEAIEALREVLQTDPFSASFVEDEIATLLLRLGRRPDAAAIVESHLAAGEQCGAAGKLADGYAATHSWEELEQLERAAFGAAQRNAEVRMFPAPDVRSRILALARHASADVPEALERAERWAREGADEGLRWELARRRGQWAEKRGDLDDAIRLYADLTETGSRDEMTFERLLILLEQAGRYAEVIAFGERALQLALSARFEAAVQTRMERVNRRLGRGVPAVGSPRAPFEVRQGASVTSSPVPGLSRNVTRLVAGRGVAAVSIEGVNPTWVLFGLGVRQEWTANSARAWRASVGGTRIAVMTAGGSTIGLVGDPDRTFGARARILDLVGTGHGFVVATEAMAYGFNDSLQSSWAFEWPAASGAINRAASDGEDVFLSGKGPTGISVRCLRDGQLVWEWVEERPSYSGPKSEDWELASRAARVLGLGQNRSPLATWRRLAQATAGVGNAAHAAPLGAYAVLTQSRTPFLLFAPDILGLPGRGRVLVGTEERLWLLDGGRLAWTAAAPLSCNAAILDDHADMIAAVGSGVCLVYRNGEPASLLQLRSTGGSADVKLVWHRERIVLAHGVDLLVLSRDGAVISRLEFTASIQGIAVLGDELLVHSGRGVDTLNIEAG